MTRLVWLILLLLLGSGVAYALTEDDIVCEQQLTARFVNGEPRVFAVCATYSGGVLMRPLREIDVTGKLTGPQLSGVNTLLTSLKAFAASVEAVPTPTP